MGTWGTGPFSSDGALDLLDELAEVGGYGSVVTMHPGLPRYRLEELLNAN